MSHAKQTRVFIAEDSEYLRDILVRSLDDIEGIVVVGHARSGLAAITGIRQARPDLLLLDLSMPHGGGFTVLEALQSEARSPLVIVLTLHTEHAFREQCSRLGAHVFLDKASEIPRLLDALHELAGRDFDLPHLLETFNHEPQLTE